MTEKFRIKRIEKMSGTPAGWPTSRRFHRKPQNAKARSLGFKFDPASKTAFPHPPLTEPVILPPSLAPFCQRSTSDQRQKYGVFCLESDSLLSDHRNSSTPKLFFLQSACELLRKHRQVFVKQAHQTKRGSPIDPRR